MLTRLALSAAALTFLLPLAVRPADPAASTKDLIGVLQSDAPLFDKARACQQLGERGTADAVPALARLLSDPKLNAFARSGLEGISGPSAAAALRDAAQTLQGSLRAGVVNSLGALRDAQAVDLLSRIASDPDSGAANQALMALGNISTPAAIGILQQAFTSGAPATRGDAAAACLLAADRQLGSGNRNQAQALYDLVRQADVPTAYRVGATRGAILVRQDDRVPFLLAQLRSTDLAIRNAALLTIREVPDGALATALNAEAASAAPELQTQLLRALADCHNAQSIDVIQALGNSPNPEVRKTALGVLGRVGPGASPALLAALNKERPAEEKTIVLAGLRGLKDPALDELLRQSLGAASRPGIRLDLIRLLEGRGNTNAAPELLTQAAGPDKEVSLVALSALRTLAGPEQVRPLLALTRSTPDEEIRGAAENALAGICNRSGEVACESVLNGPPKSANTSERNSWIRVLARGGCTRGLPAIELAAKDTDPAVAENAVAELGRWPNSGPIETLLKMLDASGSGGLRQRALTAVIDLASTATDEGQAPAATIVGWLQRANLVVESVSDKVRILGLLGRLKTVESVRLLARYLDDPSVQTEAASGIVQIAPALIGGEDASALKIPLQKIAATVPDTALRDRAVQVAKTVPAPSRAVSLFDGRSLQGWEGDTNVWRVSDGVIMGGSMRGNPRNEFLATLRPYTNFILRLEYKLVGTEGFVNSGVQFRSVRVSNPPNEMRGYQADIGAGFSGCLYDESRRNTVLARASEEAIKRLERPGDWNRYELRCEGGHIQLRLNGEKTVDYSELDTTIPQSGLIGLQIHGGNKAEVSFRNITIQEL